MIIHTCCDNNASMFVIKAEKKNISTLKEENKTKNDYRLLDKIMKPLFCEE